jgi:hypothetical protein
MGALPVIVAAISAVIALFSMWTARSSLRTAKEALAETRRNNQSMQALRSREDVMRVYDDVVRLAESLARDLPLDPHRVEPLRENLRRSSQAAGITAPEISELLEARAPLRETRVEEIKAHLLFSIDRWNRGPGQQRHVTGRLERKARKAS